MCRNSVVNVIEIEKESISTTVTTCLRPYGNQALKKSTSLLQLVEKYPQAGKIVNLQVFGCVS